MKKFNCNDMVRVISTDLSYTTYDVMAELLNLKKYVKDKLPEKDGIYRVINSAKHTYNTQSIVVGITDGKNDFMVGERGLEMYKMNEWDE